MFTQITGIWRTGPLDDRLPARTAKQVNVVQGSNATIAIQLFDSSGEPLDLNLEADDEIVFSIRRQPDGETLVARAGTKVAAGDYRFALVPVDTQYLTGFHMCDVWVTRGSTAMPVFDLSYFYVEGRVFDASAVLTVIPGGGGTPAVQDQIERSFLWTWQTTGPSVEVTIPGTGMIDGTYIVEATVAALPFADAPTAQLESNPATQLAATFILSCAAGGELLAGTTVNVFMRDRS